jgi:acyl-CoA dehydrogenase
MNNAMKNPDNAGAGSTDYMHLFGLVVLGLMWGRIALAVNEKLAAGGGDGALDAQALKNKLIVGRFFAERMLPETAAHLKRIEAGSGSVMEMPVEGF